MVVALFGAVDAAVLWSERPTPSERAWQRYWQAQATPALLPRLPPPPLEDPQVVSEPRTFPPALPEPAGLDRWFRKTLGDGWPRSQSCDLMGAVEIDLSGLSPEARTGVLLLGRFLPADAGVSILQDGERLRITLSGDSDDV